MAAAIILLGLGIWGLSALLDDGGTDPTIAAAPVEDTSEPDDTPAPEAPPEPVAGPAVDVAHRNVSRALGSASIAASESAPNAARKAAETPPDRTVIRFSTNPAGAKVVVNGRAVGTTPCSTVLQGLEPARISMTKFGFRPMNFSLKPAGGQQSVSRKLKPARIRLAP